MKICQKCWQNLKNEKANYIIRNKINKNGYLICKKCTESEDIKSMIETGKWEIIEVKNEK